jgi:hypothetical protein
VAARAAFSLDSIFEVEKHSIAAHLQRIVRRATDSIEDHQGTRLLIFPKCQ